MLEQIAAGEIGRYIGRRDCIILDVRDKAEYEAGHVIGAKLMEVWKLEKLLGATTGKLRELPEPILVLYCERGGESLRMARYLSRRGYQVKNVTGGMKQLRNHREYLERGRY